MKISKKNIGAAAVAAIFGLGAISITAGTASAYVACNGAGECWHTDTRYHYDHREGVQIHADDWYFHRDWAHDTNHHWRDYHQGRGVYRNGVWVTF